MQITILPAASKFFWGDDLSQLNWEKHKKYIIQTLLEKGDAEAIEWLMSVSSREEIKKILPSLKLSAKSMSFWRLILS